MKIIWYVYKLNTTCIQCDVWAKKLSVEGAIAYIKSLAKTCQQIALKKDKYIFLITSGEIGY